MQTSEPIDCVILGAGPAGIACALELHEARLNYVMLERGPLLAPQLLEIPNTLRNFAGGFFNSGAEYQKRIEDLTKKISCKYRLGHDVQEIDLSRRVLTAGGREFSANAILIATGCRTRKLDLEREQELGVYYTIEGRTPEFKDRSVAVVGGGESALLDALELSHIAREVYLIHRGQDFRARPAVVGELLQNKRIQPILKAQVSSLEGKERLTGIHIVDASGGDRLLPVDKLVAKIGYVPNTELFKGQLALDPAGHILIHPDGSTSCPRVFAAGDVTSPPYLRISAAVGQGMIAAASICKVNAFK
jgi:thioredoxin reductase (NADPH)